MACGAAAASAALRQLGASWQADAVDRSAQPKLGGCWRRESRIAVVGNNTGVEEWKRDACREGGVARYREAASMRRAPRWQRHALPGGGEKERLINDQTYLQTSARGMALLLLGAVNPGSLTAGALASRGLALSAGHCCDTGCAG